VTDVLKWKRGLTIDQDPDSKLIYTLDLKDWFGATAEIIAYQLLAEEPLVITYDAQEGKLISFKVSGTLEGERRGVTVRVTIGGEVQQQDDRTIYFRGRHQ
jgi:hypothetical protein